MNRGRDISAEVFGKYQHCGLYEGQWYAQSDLDLTGKPEPGAQPKPERFTVSIPGPKPASD